MTKGGKGRGVLVGLDGVHRVTARGHVYLYAWRGGPRLDPDDLIGSYHRAHAARRAKAEAEAGGTTIAARLAAFRAQDRRSPKQKRNVAFAHQILAEELGHFDVAALEDRRMRGDVLAIRNRMADTPRKADFFAQEATLFANWLYDRGEIGAHVLSRLGKLATADRAAIVWRPAEVDAVMAHLPNDHARRFFGLALETGLDPCDLRRLSWAHVHEHSIEIPRQKTGFVAAPPITKEARRILDACDRSAFLVVPSSRGTPYRNFNTLFGAAKRKAGVSGLRLKDARGTAATRFCLAIPDDAAIADMMGWSLAYPRAIRRRYVDRDTLAKARAERIGAAECKTSGENL